MLNTSQRKAIEHFGKPLLIVAGAGSGKTKTLTHKVEHLIIHYKLFPERILVLTFTNKAGREIKERIKKTTNMDLPYVGTFHSFALNVLREDYEIAGYYKMPNVLDEEDRDRLLKSFLRSKNLDLRLLDKLKAYMFKRIEDLNPPTDSVLEALMKEYIAVMRDNNYVDFSGLLLSAYKVFKVKPSWRERFDFILVDEFQDTNTIQYVLIKLLASDNVCVVGDPNQCIYEWRYARPDNVLRFKRDFKPDIIKLEENYRSTKSIIALANAILENSKSEWKDLVPMLRSKREVGTKPCIKSFADESEEARWIAEKIKELSNVYPFKDIAVLVRTGYITNSIERALALSGIPYTVIGQVKFFQRAEIKDAMSFLRILSNPKDEISFERALKVARVGVGKETIKVIKSINPENLLSACVDTIRKGLLRKGISEDLRAFLEVLRRLRENLHNYPQAFEEFLDSLSFWEYVEDTYEESQERKENVRELLRYMQEKHREKYTIEDILSETLLDSEKEEKDNGVKIMTIHASKGLEFSAVFLPRFEDGIIPHSKGLDEQDLEEELRLFYVASTRAKDRLFITYTRAKGRQVSRFLHWVPKNLLDWLDHHWNRESHKVVSSTHIPELKNIKKLRIGDRVRHKVFGEGIVLEVVGEKAHVRFGKEEKTIYTSFLELLP